MNSIRMQNDHAEPKYYRVTECHYNKGKEDTSQDTTVPSIC